MNYLTMIQGHETIDLSLMRLERKKRYKAYYLEQSTQKEKET
jgi:hypothetical protein